MKVLIVGGEQAFIKGKWRTHLESVGLELGWHWDYKRRRFPSFPPSADAVILIQDMCSHKLRTLASKGAKKHGTPFAEVSRQWVKALPILTEKGIVIDEFGEVIQQPTHQPQPILKGGTIMTKPTSEKDFKTYLKLCLEKPEDYNNPDELVSYMTDLLSPHKLTEEQISIIKLKFNVHSIKTEEPQNPVKTTERNHTDRFLSRVDKGIDVADQLTQAKLDYCLKQFMVLSKRRGSNAIPIPNKLRNIMQQVLNSPIKTSAFIVKLCQKTNATIGSRTANAIYQRITGKHHNYTAPTEVYEYLGVSEWETQFPYKDETEVEASQVVPKTEPKARQASDETVQLLQTILTKLTSMESRLDALEELAKEPKNQIPTNATNNNEISFTIPKDEILNYLLENNKLTLTLK